LQVLDVVRQWLTETAAAAAEKEVKKMKEMDFQVILKSGGP